MTLRLVVLSYWIVDTEGTVGARRGRCSRWPPTRHCSRCSWSRRGVGRRAAIACPDVGGLAEFVRQHIGQKRADQALGMIVRAAIPSPEDGRHDAGEGLPVTGDIVSRMGSVVASARSSSTTAISGWIIGLPARLIWSSSLHGSWRRRRRAGPHQVQCADREEDDRQQAGADERGGGH